MSSNATNNFFAYRSRVVHLEEIVIPVNYLRAPTETQRSQPETRIRVRLVGDRIEPSQQLRRSARNTPLFVFHEGHAANLRVLTEARAVSCHNILGYLGRGGRQVALGAVVGAFLGTVVGVCLIPVCPPLGSAVLLSGPACLPVGVAAGAAAGAAGGAVAGGGTGGTGGVGGAAVGGAGVGAGVGTYSAWTNERDTIRVIDYILNFNKLCQNYLAEQTSTAQAASQLLALYRLRPEIGTAGEMLFDEALCNMEASQDPRMQSLTRDFLLLRGPD